MFPPELIDAIIDNLHYDRKALSKFSLVSSAWRARSQYHLLADVCLTTQNARKFNGLPYPSNIISFGRRLLLRSGSIPDALQQFSSITALYISIASFRGIPKNLSSIFPGITYLEFDEIVVATSFTRLVQILCGFTNLRVLTLSCAWHHDALPLNAIRLPPGLHTLNLQCSDLQLLLTWIRNHDPPPALFTIRLHEFSKDLFPQVGATLGELGGTLKYLEFDRLYSADPAVDNALDFSRCSALKSILILNGGAELSRDLLRPCLQHAQLDDATITMDVDNKPDANLSVWLDLDEIVMRAAQSLPNFKLYVRMLGADFKAPVVAYRMPRCSARGILRLVNEDYRMALLQMTLTGPISSHSWGDVISG